MDNGSPMVGDIIYCTFFRYISLIENVMLPYSTFETKLQIQRKLLGNNLN